MKTVPIMTTDAEAEAFLNQDLSNLDFSQFRPMTWETAPKDARINMRVPGALMAALKAKAAKRGIPYQRLIRELLEKGV
jgi:predicted DNA binding CopG/RHH family protein